MGRLGYPPDIADVAIFLASDQAAWVTGQLIHVGAIKIQEIELPAEIKRAIAKQAEAERERRAMIIASEGELSASRTPLKVIRQLQAPPRVMVLHRGRDKESTH